MSGSLATEHSVGPDYLNRLFTKLQGMQFEASVYFGSRVLILFVAVAVALFTRSSLASELSNWDGVWYLRVVHHGYPSYVPAGQSTLGFLPLYPMLIVILSHLLFISPLLSGLLVSIISGFVAVVLAGRLAREWWGDRAGMWAVAILSFFPGSVIFSMVYPEGLTAALGAGCLFALSRHRWVLAGVCAALAGLLEPVGLVAVPVCALVALITIYKEGRGALSSLSAPVISVLGIGGFAVFLWAWTGTPFASIDAQRSGWHQGSTPFILIYHVLAGITTHPTRFISQHSINLDFVSGVVGAIFLILAFIVMIRRVPRPPMEVLAWVAGIGLITMWSIRTPPNARILIVTFPAIIVWAQYLKGRSLSIFLSSEIVLLIIMSALTFHGHILSP